MTKENHRLNVGQWEVAERSLAWTNNFPQPWKLLLHLHTLRVFNSSIFQLSVLFSLFFGLHIIYFLSLTLSFYLRKFCPFIYLFFCDTQEILGWSFEFSAWPNTHMGSWVLRLYLLKGVEFLISWKSMNKFKRGTIKVFQQVWSRCFSFVDIDVSVPFIHIWTVIYITFVTEKEKKFLWSSVSFSFFWQLIQKGFWFRGFLYISLVFPFCLSPFDLGWAVISSLSLADLPVEF